MRARIAFILLLPAHGSAQNVLQYWISLRDSSLQSSGLPPYWALLGDDITRSSRLKRAPGSTFERDVQALIKFFNVTCTESQEDPTDAANPYRGAFAQVSQWRQQQGWSSIVSAHADVAVQCRRLNMEGGEEFTAKHCFWNIQSLANRTVYPSPQWTIVEDCCERLQRPVMHVHDAVWATTRGVGRFRRRAPGVTTGVAATYAPADDDAYVPALDCDLQINEEAPDCQPQNLYNRNSQRCTQDNVDQCRTRTPVSRRGIDNNCCPVAKPIGLRSKHYFNVGLAVGAKGTIVRTMDGGYSWDCLRGCTRTAGQPDAPDLLSISVNVRMGGFGYENSYYNAQAGPNMDGVDFTLLNLQGSNIGVGLDGVYWPAETRMEGYAVGVNGVILRIDDAGVTGWDPSDIANNDQTVGAATIVQVTASNSATDSGCVTTKTIRDVFFWNVHLSFFVGDRGFICRYGLSIQPNTATQANSAVGPGLNVDDVLDPNTPLEPTWDLEGADEQDLSWGRIVDNSDYMFSNFRSVFCLQVADLSPLNWVRTVMTEATMITYSQHLTCFAVGTHPGTAGTTSAILRYRSRAVFLGIDDTGKPLFSEDISWKPQNSMTTMPLNDVYCVKSRVLRWYAQTPNFGANDPLYCYAVGDGGLIRYTANGGDSPWRTLFSGVLENLNKVVIIGVTPVQDGEEQGYGTGGANAGSQAVVVGDNGRVLYTNDAGNTWQKLERVTPEHLISIQFNAFDDFYYFTGGPVFAAESVYFEDGVEKKLPFGNGIATGAVMYDWMAYTGQCGFGSPNDGQACTRSYNCRKPELSVVLRTNCGGTLTSTHWRCQSECVDAGATVAVALEDTLATVAVWNRYFGTTTSMQQGVAVTTPKLPRARFTELYARVPKCDEVWTIGHGRAWHEDTRETKRSEQAPVTPDCLYVDFEDVKAIRPAHEMCMYGWPRHKYMLDQGRRRKVLNNVTSRAATRAEYTFLGRLRHSQENCTALGGRYYEAELHHLEDCVFEFGDMTSCTSWEVHGLGHTLDRRIEPRSTRIPYINYSVITDPCLDEWFGVTCDEEHAAVAIPNQTVTQLWLYSNNLQGEIPSSIRELFSLRSFSLGSNRLTGLIPSTVWRNLTDLRYLSLAENSLIGTIPETLTGLRRLEELRLHANYLTGNIPTALGRLSNLQSLSLHANNLQGQIPSELGALSALQYLWMSSNNLTGALPTEIGRLGHLRYLWFANNSITRIPAELGELTSLRSIDGSNNSISDRLPYSLGRLSNLKVLKFGHNRLRATIPDALGSCVSMVIVELQHNQLIGPVPASFGELEELTTLDISHNLLERRVPDSIEGMRNLQTLLLNDNNLEGGLPSSIGTLRRLQHLNLARNRLTVGLPDTLANCDNLELIDLQNNQIDGPLPAGIWRLQTLEYLLMTGNRVRGPLPEGIGYLAQIREIRLDRNLIDGTIPATIGDAVTLEVLRMDDNRLSGSIPSTMGQLRNVLNLDLHKNSLVGTIPTQIAGMQSMLTLYLHENQLGGQIPDTIGNLSSLRELRASRNRLAGVIPASFGNLGSLLRLQLDQNSIGGSIPETLGRLRRRLRMLHLQGNRINGLLPTFFRYPEFRLVSIDLANNELWCPLPAWPALNNTASCRHCPNDIYLDDAHRTCSDHGVCVDGQQCRCDPMWEGETCNLLRCPNACNQKGNCINEREPEACVLSGGARANTTSVVDGLCENLSDDCIKAFHDCPQNGISVQVDSEGIVLAEEITHNQIVFARCICDPDAAYFGNDCSMPPLSPPTAEPWPDPYASAAPKRAAREGAAASMSFVLVMAAAVAIGRAQQGRRFQWPG